MKPPDDVGDDYVEYLLGECAKHAGTILMAVDGDAPVGYAVVLTAVSSKDEVDEIDYRYAYIPDLMVTRSYRRRGIASQLLSRCEDLARDAGVQWLRITALTQNADAVRTYEGAGFSSLLSVMEKPIGG